MFHSLFLTILFLLVDCKISLLSSNFYFKLKTDSFFSDYFRFSPYKQCIFWQNINAEETILELNKIAYVENVWKNHSSCQKKNLPIFKRSFSKIPNWYFIYILKTNLTRMYTSNYILYKDFKQRIFGKSSKLKRIYQN